MNYDHFFSFSINEATAGLGVYLSFGDELPPPDTTDGVEFWGIRIVFIIFEVQLGVITSEV